MIKRRFYRHEHGDRNSGSDSSSSSSDSELEAEATEETEAEDDVAEVREYHESRSSSSGYESEDSSANEVDVDSSGFLTNDDGDVTGNGQNFIKSYSSGKSDAEIVDTLPDSVAEKDSVPSSVGCILKCKSVFRCRLCPRIVCLTEETLKAHLKSKRHARSEKLLNEGRLKLMLNSDGEMEEEEDGETHAERHARIVAATQNSANSRGKNRGRQRQRKRLKKKEKGKDTNSDKARQSTKSPAKKRHKSEN